MKFMRKLAASVAAVTVAATSVATFAFSASALTYENDAIVSTDKGPYTAYLCIQAGADKRFVTDAYPNAVEEEKNSEGISCADATFTGDGTYTASVTVANGSGTIELLMLETDINSYAFAPENAETEKGALPTGCTASIVINSITVKQTSGSSYTIPYNGASNGALRQGDNGSSIRVNILNIWTTPKVSDISNDLSGLGGLAGGDTVEVSFTVSGLNAGGNGGEENTDPATTTTGAGGLNDEKGETTTTAAGGTTTTTTNGGNSGSSGNSSSGKSGSSGSSGNSSSGSSSGNKSSNNSTVSQTGDFGIAAVVIGGVAAAALGAGAYTVTRRKK